MTWTLIPATGSLLVSGPPPTFVLDDFSRPDGGLGSNWTNVTGSDPLAIVSGVAKNSLGSGGGNGKSIWTANNFTNDQFGEIKGNTFLPGVVLRGDPAAANYYVLYINSGSNWDVYKGVGGSETGIATPVTGQVVTTSDIIRFSVTGTTFSVLLNGTPIGSTFTDSTYSAGKPGISIFQTGQITYFKAGTLV